MNTYVLYNPLAGNSTCEQQAQVLEKLLSNKQLRFCSMTEIDNYADFFSGLVPSDEVVLCGGDGTLNFFVNATKDINIENDILYFAAGSGNDFLHDIGKEKGCVPFKINKYLSNLPRVTVNGKESIFVNAIGFGLDGYCCEAGDEKRKTANGKPVNYTSIAIKGLLYAYKPSGATVIVDGVERRYKKVWIAPAMHGRFYGGGMNAAPHQDREDAEPCLTLVVWHTSGKLKTLMAFPSIFKGEPIKHTKCIDVIKGHDITVRFDRPCALQIDGETVLNVTEYTAKSAAKVNAEKKAAATV
ncbi:MAG: diacylglycerol kinase family protein [Oscillospiraceae bacterium]|nr:diacylglycerol kinase family protein [Oscillospiraceae bacterium]